MVYREIVKEAYLLELLHVYVQLGAQLRLGLRER